MIPATATRDKLVSDETIVARVCAKHNLHPDQDLYWLWCGTEANAALLGPWEDPEGAEFEAKDAKETGYCSHDHVVVRMSMSYLRIHNIPRGALNSNSTYAAMREFMEDLKCEIAYSLTWRFSSGGAGPGGLQVSVAF